MLEIPLQGTKEPGTPLPEAVAWLLEVKGSLLGLIPMRHSVSLQIMEK